MESFLNFKLKKQLYLKNRKINFIKNSILFLLFLNFLTGISCLENSELKNGVNRDSIATPNLPYSKDIYLKNDTDTSISLTYLDYFSDRIQLLLKPKEAKFIKTDFPLWLFDPRVNHRNNYLISPGDSLVLTYTSNGAIYMNCINRKENLNVFLTLNKDDSENLYQIIFGKNYTTSDLKYISITSTFFKKYLSDKCLLDSLKNSNKISVSFFNCLQNVVYLDYLSKLYIGVWNNKSLSPLVVNTKKREFDSIYKHLLSTNYENVCSPLQYKNVIYSYFVRHVQFSLDQDPFAKNTYVKPDSDTLYKYAKKEFLGNEYLYNKILFLIVKEELVAFPKSKKDCIRDFLADCTDSTLLQYIIELKSNKVNIDGSGKGDVLVDFNGNNHFFSDVINSNLGRVIYIDVWASWCIPCRQEFEYSKKLKKVFKDTDVVFVYISIDNNSILWKRASKEENLNNYSNSYILPDFELSEFKNVMRISGIPRYILIDRKGQVYSSKAPRPSEPLVLDQIKSLL